MRCARARATDRVHRVFPAILLLQVVVIDPPPQAISGLVVLARLTLGFTFPVVRGTHSFRGAFDTAIIFDRALSHIERTFAISCRAAHFEGPKDAQGNGEGEHAKEDATSHGFAAAEDGLPAHAAARRELLRERVVEKLARETDDRERPVERARTKARVVVLVAHRLFVQDRRQRVREHDAEKEHDPSLRSAERALRVGRHTRQHDVLVLEHEEEVVPPRLAVDDAFLVEHLGELVLGVASIGGVALLRDGRGGRRAIFFFGLHVAHGSSAGQGRERHARDCALRKSKGLGPHPRGMPAPFHARPRLVPGGIGL